MATPSVRKMQGAGFKLVGPPVEDSCRFCQHVWGDHVLCPAFEDNPFKGGTVECPQDGCRCVGTWGVPNAPQIPHPDEEV